MFMRLSEHQYSSGKLKSKPQMEYHKPAKWLVSKRHITNVDDKEKERTPILHIMLVGI
jgi:hypothetical protein